MKIIASDFDNTITYEGKIRKEDIEAIKRFRDAGNKFGIVTGRDLEFSSFIKKENGFDFDFMICCTGGSIKNEKGEIIYMKKGKIEQFVFDMIDKAISMNAEYFTVNDMLYKYAVDTTGAIPLDLSKLSEFTQLNCGFADEKSVKEFCEYVQHNYSDKISPHINALCVDMPPANTSKVTGIYEYIKRFDSPTVYTVGDNITDIPMIKEFCGFAVSNARDEVKSVAKHHCNRIADMIDTIMSE